MTISNFMREALNSGDQWNISHVVEVGQLTVPDLIFGPRHGSIIKGDLHSLWASWFLEAIVDPAKYTASGMTYVDIYSDVLSRVKLIFAHSTKFEQEDLAKYFADLVLQRVNVLKLNRSRRTYSSEIRLALFERTVSNPRCWICGFLFSEETCDAFLNKRSLESKHSHPFVDIYKPLGLDPRDSQIEIEHVVPHSSGGGDGDNLRLSCGWCNRHKSMFSSLYDIGGTAVSVRNAFLGIRSLPRKFWTVRLLGLVQRCEHPSGCSAQVSNTELTVEPLDELGVPNPANLRVVCGDHHRMGHTRLLPAELVRKIWNSE